MSVLRVWLHLYFPYKIQSLLKLKGSLSEGCTRPLGWSGVRFHREKKHAAICLSTCSPPLDSCHTLPWRPQGGGRGLFCQPKPCVHCWSGSDYYSPERGKYEHLCDLKQNLPSTDRLMVYHAAALQRFLLCKTQLNIWKHKKPNKCKKRGRITIILL